MNRFVNSISSINNNVFVLTPLLLSFYKNLKKTEFNMLLCYFVFPIVLNEDCCLEINTLRSNSRLSRIVSNKKYMAGFHENYEYYKQITNNCMQYAIDCGYIRIDEKLSVEVIGDGIKFVDPSLKKSMSLASQLHNVFSMDVVNIYLAFGIKEL